MATATSSRPGRRPASASQADVKSRRAQSAQRGSRASAAINTATGTANGTEIGTANGTAIGATHGSPNGTGAGARHGLNGVPAALNPNATISQAPPTGERRKAESIEECLLRSLEQYFADLDGAKPHALHDMVLQAIERPLLRFALARAAGNQSAAAELLGINRNTLRKKLLEYRLV